MLRSIIDSEKLIEEVKKRPALYDGRAHGNNDANARKAYWEEITKDVFHEVWDTSSSNEKEALVKEVQVKWKSLRDAYNRVKKQEKDDQMKGVVKNRKKYIFYDQLSFLETINKRTCSPNAIFLQDHEERNDDSMDNTYFSSETSNLFKADQEMYEPNTSTVVKPLEDTVSEQRETEDRLSSILKELVKIQKEDRADDRMGNKKFLLSLLPFMEKLPDDVNLEVRLQLMSILQTYSSGESFMKT
ncbi:hypothetical protein MTP99_001338 [Tenebrio molitor]|jgi:hypothetical protein|uniref:uncharacterized protein n=1 Tax=Tenebrio molitor TaxID=7067 RepID=UPI001C3B7F01|nr:hypothetical protein MTP99_001338 [Tenebrio molitor]CAH1365026.1 unnamed protein product [Tenebrio molitor]